MKPEIPVGIPLIVILVVSFGMPVLLGFPRIWYLLGVLIFRPRVEDTAFFESAYEPQKRSDAENAFG